MFYRLMITTLLFSTSLLFSMTLVEVNSATKAEFMEIKGIGEKKASAIIAEREKREFSSLDDLKRVSGIGDKMVSNIENGIKSGSKPKKSVSDEEVNASTPH
jgi:competence protein ComEA